MSGLEVTNSMNYLLVQCVWRFQRLNGEVYPWKKCNLQKREKILKYCFYKEYLVTIQVN